MNHIYQTKAGRVLDRMISIWMDRVSKAGVLNGHRGESRALRFA